MDIQGRATFEPRSSERTVLTISVDIPGLDDPEKVEFMRSMMQRSVDNMRSLMEAEP
jgi:hypothetical protein